MLFRIAFKQDVAVFLDQALGRGRSARLGLLFVVLEQGAAGRAANPDGQLVLAQVQVLTVAATGLQGEGTQAQCIGQAHAPLRVGQRIGDAGIGQGLAAACGGHVDDEGALLKGCLTDAGGSIHCLVLPAELRVGAASAQRPMIGQPGEMAFEAGQGMGNGPGVTGNPEQVFEQGLFELAVAVGVGIQRCMGADAEPLRCRRRQAGIVVVGQHQAQPCQVHHIRIVQPGLVVAWRQCQQTTGDTGCLLAPLGIGHWQGIGRLPVGQCLQLGVVLADLVPVMGDQCQRLLQPQGVPVHCPFAQPVLRAILRPGNRNDGQPVVGNDQPGDGCRQRRQFLERIGVVCIQTVALIAAGLQPVLLAVGIGISQPL